MIVGIGTIVIRDELLFFWSFDREIKVKSSMEINYLYVKCILILENLISFLFYVEIFVYVKKRVGDFRMYLYIYFFINMVFILFFYKYLYNY